MYLKWFKEAVRNKATFEDSRPYLEGSYNTVISHYVNYQKELMPRVQRVIGKFDRVVTEHVLFFDGAANLGNCGAGGVIYISQDYYFTIKMKCGKGTNMKAELLALWCVAKVANVFGLVNVKIFGESRVTIKWARGEFELKILNLTGWCNRVKKELNSFGAVTLEHIFREYNSQANLLSKQDLEGEDDYIYWDEFCENQLIDSGTCYFLD